jgi:hypothetical protein
MYYFQFLFSYILTCGYILIQESKRKKKKNRKKQESESTWLKALRRFPFVPLFLSLNLTCTFHLSLSLPVFERETINILNSWTSLYCRLSHIFLLFIYSFPHHSLLTPFSWFPFIMEDASGNQLFLFICYFLNFQKGFLFSRCFLVWMCSVMV